MTAKAGAPAWVREALDDHGRRRPRNIATLAAQAAKVDAGVQRDEAAGKVSDGRRKGLADLKAKLAYWRDPKAVPDVNAAPASAESFKAKPELPATYGVKVLEIIDGRTALCEVRVGGGYGGQEGTANMKPSGTGATAAQVIVAGDFLKEAKPGVMWNKALRKTGSVKRGDKSLPAMEYPDPQPYLESKAK